RELAGAAAAHCRAERSGSNRFGDREGRLRRARDRFDSVIRGRAMKNVPALSMKRPSGTWRQRLIRKLLFGTNVDRHAKARARVGFAILGFFLVYAVIGGKLIMYAVAPEARGERHTAAQDALATARPDIVDRNGEILATDVKA